MQNSFIVAFPNQSSATAIRLQPGADLAEAIADLGLPTHRPVLVIIGGAKWLTAGDRVRSLFQESLVPLATQWNAVVLDGGTQAGVMQLMGESRHEGAGQFPLVGVAPAALVHVPAPTGLETSEELPPDTSTVERVCLEPHHTHFLLVPGTTWGDESATLANLAQAIAQGAPIVTVLCNGGDITWQDAWENAQRGHILIVLAGTGRAADEIAHTVRGEAPTDRALALLEITQLEITQFDRTQLHLNQLDDNPQIDRPQANRLKVVDVQAGSTALTAAIADVFSKSALTPKNGL
jgi:SLOG in TRPM, prokaryote